MLKKHLYYTISTDTPYQKYWRLPAVLRLARFRLWLVVQLESEKQRRSYTDYTEIYIVKNLESMSSKDRGKKN